jgi:hypothetical protein
MRIAVIIMMMTQYSRAIETIICYGREENYNCEKYNGGDIVNYSYAQEFLTDNIHVHESGYIDSSTESNDTDGEQKPEPVNILPAPTYYQTPFYFLPVEFK